MEGVSEGNKCQADAEGKGLQTDRDAHTHTHIYLSPLTHIHTYIHKNNIQREHISYPMLQQLPEIQHTHLYCTHTCTINSYLVLKKEKMLHPGSLAALTSQPFASFILQFMYTYFFFFFFLCLVYFFV